MIPPEIIDRIRDTTDIVEIISQYVSLKSTGKGFKGLCPFHSEKTPSFTVNPDRQFFHCFGCKAGGNVYHFLMRAEGLTFIEAVRELAQKAGMDLPDADHAASSDAERMRQQLLEVTAWAAGRFQAALQNPKTSIPVQAYLRQREVTEDSVRQFGLGYAPAGWDNLLKAGQRDHYSESLLEKAGLIIPRKEGSGNYDRFRNRLMFPIRDLHGRPVAFGGRVLGDEEPKYLNSSETAIFHKGDLLYGLDIAKENARVSERIILVEGYMDALACHAAGVLEAVASLGTALTSVQARLIRRFAGQVILIYDADEAGWNATLRAFELLNREGIEVRVAALADAKDPDEFIRRHGREAFQRLLPVAMPLVEFMLSRVMAQENLERVEGKIAVLNRLSPIIAQLTSPVARQEYSRTIAERLHLDEGAVREELAQRPRNLGREKKAEVRPSSAAVSQTPNRREEELAVSILLKHPRQLELQKEKLNPEFFTVSNIRKLVEGLLAFLPLPPEGEDEWVARWLTTVTEPELADTAAALMAQEKRGGNPSQVIQDCLKRLEANWLRDKIYTLQQQIQEAQKRGERELFKQLAQQEMEYKNCLKRLGVDWRSGLRSGNFGTRV